MKYGQLEEFINFLLKLELEGKNSYKRTKICKKMDSYYSEKCRKVLLSHVEKNEDNEPVINVKSDGSKSYNILDQEELNKELDEILNLDFDLDFDKNERTFLKKIVLETDKIFKEEEALIYHYWCEFVENL